MPADQTDDKRRGLSEEGRCRNGHNPRFTYELEGVDGCVACERDAAYAKGREDQRKADAEIAGKVVLDPAHSGPCDSHGICDSCTIKHEIAEAIERGGEK